jgi:hypothetical protein
MAVAEQDAPEWVLITDAVAKPRGFCNALALKRWARSRGVPIKEDGKKRWIRLADIRPPSERMPVPQLVQNPPDPPAPSVEADLDAMKAEGRAAAKKGKR